MPTLDDLLSQTMLFTAAHGSRKQPIEVPAGKSFHSPKLVYRTFEEIDKDSSIVNKDAAKRDVARHNAIWQFRWDPSDPGTFRNVTCNTRGMGMDYAMAAEVFDKVEFLGLQIQRKPGDAYDLFITPEFLLGAWWRPTGHVPGGERMWPLEAQIDASLVAAFGYQLTDNGITPLSMEDVEGFGDKLMPAEGFLGKYCFTAGDPGEHCVTVGPCRYIVAIELVLCKERPDFVPGNIVSFARIGPHAFLWSNEELTSVECTISLQRPRHGMKCGTGMKGEIGVLLVTDTNDEHSVLGNIDRPLPFTDNLYDYYCTEPRKVFGDRELSFADASKTFERTHDKVVTRLTDHIRNHRDIRKCKRQGEFDNIHLASRMQLKLPDVKDPTLDNIVMINMCVHDCVHTHVRWGEFIDSQLLAGWGEAGPYTKPGAPQVPPNQSVFISFPASEGVEMKYRAVAQNCRVGEPQVFFHHGSAYAIDEWPSAEGVGNKIVLLDFVDTFGGPCPYAGDFGDEWMEFYWRVRYMMKDGKPVERLQFDLKKCMP